MPSRICIAQPKIAPMLPMHNAAKTNDDIQKVYGFVSSAPLHKRYKAPGERGFPAVLTSNICSIRMSSHAAFSLAPCPS